jgi:hypothetical protein
MKILIDSVIISAFLFFNYAKSISNIKRHFLSKFEKAVTKVFKIYHFLLKK